MTEIEIGRAKRARPAYALDDIAISLGWRFAAPGFRSR